MNRRKFIGGSAAGLLAGGGLGWPGAARAQPQKLPVIGLVDGVWPHLTGQVGRGLRENGLVGGRDFNVEFSRWTGKQPDYQADQMAMYVAELVKRQAALIVAFSTKAALAAKAVTSTTPIIFLADDPVASGLVDNLDRPGGNLTGAASPVSDLIAKRIEIIRELVPATNLVVLVTDPSNKPAHDIEIREAEAAAQALGLQHAIIAWTGEHSVEIALAELPRERKGVLVLGAGLPFFAGRAHLSYLATRYEMPAIHGYREAAEDGGLVSFGTRLVDGAHLMGVHAARVLNGGKPADLPVRQITTTELVINLWTAKSLGLQVPAKLLARADELIES
jgi:putative ABC transport system substrate-binding protein